MASILGMDAKVCLIVIEQMKSAIQVCQTDMIFLGRSLSCKGSKNSIQVFTADAAAIVLYRNLQIIIHNTACDFDGNGIAFRSYAMQDGIFHQ